MAPPLRGALTAFILLNLVTVGFVHRPPKLTRQVVRAIDARLPSRIGRALQRAGWLLLRYAHLAGLDNRWTMFSHLPRYQWRYVIHARYADGATLALPLPRQSQRTSWQRNVTDFKEAKFHLNLYVSEPARTAYARYLCREHPRHGEAPAQELIWELHHRAIFPPDVARQRGNHLDPQSRQRVYTRVACSP